MDWPFVRTGSASIPAEIPDRGFNRIVRVSYRIHALARRSAAGWAPHFERTFGQVWPSIGASREWCS